MKYHHSIIFLAILILAGCSSNSGLTSSFGSRKYTQGVFWNKPDKVEAKSEIEIKNETRLNQNSGKNRIDSKMAKNVQALINKTTTPVRSAITVQVKALEVQPCIKIVKPTINILPEPTTDKPATGKDKETHLGKLGFLLITCGIVVAFVSLILAIAFAVGGAGVMSAATLSIALIFGLISVLSILAIIAGIVLCIIALIHTDQDKGLAKAGIIIASVLVLLIVLLSLPRGV